MDKFKILPIFLMLVQFVYGQTSNCKTPFNENGSCVGIRDCSSIWRIITEAPRPLDQRVLTFLQQSTCGELSQRRVCCRFQDVTSNDAGNVVQPQQPPVTVATPAQTQASNEVLNHPNLRQLDQRNCGPISSDRIAHGNETVLYEFPWMALLGYTEQGGDVEWKCGGSVINKRYVLTAAHCVTNLNRGSRLDTVRLGEYDISKETDCMKIGNEVQCTPPVQDIGVERTIAHPGFNRPKKANDIALVRLASEADFSQFAVAPICLPISQKLMTDPINGVTVTGWGTTETQQTSSVLLKADIRYVRKETCQSTLKINIVDGQFCAGGDQMQDSCNGDSGGPLQTPANLGGTKYVQFGIVSFGVSGCGNRQARPGVYADVRYYLKWILDNLQS